MKTAICALLLFVAVACSSGREPPIESVTAASSAAGTYAYTFDPSGLATSVGTTGTSYAITRQTSSIHAGADVYSLDALGRAVAIDDLEIAYGPDGQIDHATKGGVTFSYLYDEDGQRILKSTNGTPNAAYVDDALVTATELDEPVRFGERLVGLLQNGDFALAATDMRGTVQADLDGTSLGASPFGTRPVHPDVSAAFDYAERRFDADLALDRMGARDYDARLAAFLEPDPLFLLHPEKCVDSPIECSLYGYARARPLDYTDPTGLDSYLVTVQPGRLVGIDFRLDRATHEFSLRLDLFMEKGSPSVPSFAAGWTSRGLLHDELSIFGRVEAGERIGDLNLLYGQADARIGTAGVKFDGSVSSVPGRVGFSYQRHDGKTEKRRYEDIAPRGAFPERDPAEFKSQPRRLRYGVSASINSREIRTLPARVDAAINKWWSNWDWQVRQMILGQHGF